MDTIRITIEIRKEVESSNPFLDKAKALELRAQFKLEVDEANTKVRDAHNTILSGMQERITNKLGEAKITYYTNRVFDKLHLHARKSFAPLYGEFIFFISIQGRNILVRLTPTSRKVEGLEVYDGGYTLAYTLQSNPEQMKFGNSSGWIRFTTQEEVEKEIVNLIRVE